MKLLIIGSRHRTGVGGCFERAAKELDVDISFLESKAAFKAPYFVSKFNRWFCDKRPPRIENFSRQAVEQCRLWKPDALLATGIAPLNHSALAEIQKMNIKTLNFLTDDPWAINHKSRWFLKAILNYDFIFTPRRSNIGDLQNLKVRNVRYLPFGYDPELQDAHHGDEEKGLEKPYDVIFVGGADRERDLFIQAIIRQRLKLTLYGQYWGDRFGVSNIYARGEGDVMQVTEATRSAKVALCLVRRSNRDGHCMRTYEIPAIGACMLAEDTQEHREIFGKEGAAVLYFSTVQEMLVKLRELLNNRNERIRLAMAAHQLIVEGKNSYKDRLQMMLNTAINSIKKNEIFL